MLNNKIFSLLGLVAILTLSVVSTFAQQESDRGEGAAALKKRIFEQIASGARPLPIEIPIEVMDLSPIAEDATAQQNLQRDLQGNGLQDILGRQRKAFLGTWNLTLTFGDGSVVKSTLNVAPGNTETEGSVVHSAELSLTFPNPTSNEQGTWRHVGGNQFVASYRGYAVTDKFEPFGTVGFKQVLNVSDNQESFTGRAVLEVIDSKGVVLFTDMAQVRGARQHAVAP